MPGLPHLTGGGKTATPSQGGGDQSFSLPSLTGGGSTANFSVPPLTGPTPAAAPKKKGGGGFLHTLGHIVKQTGSDLEHVALNTPSGLATIGKAAWADEKAVVRGAIHGETHKSASHGSELLDKVVKPTLSQTKAVAEHPLRNPGITALSLLPVAGTAARAGEGAAAASAAAKAGEGASAIVKAAVKPAVGERVLKVGGAEARGHYSRAAGARVAQKVTDTGLQKAAEKSLRAENLLHRRAAKWNERTLRVQDAKARAAGTRLQALGAKLKPEEQRALRLVAEEVPVARRLGAQEMRKARASARDVGRHQERIDLTRKAAAFLDEGPNGKPVFKPGATKLAKVYDALKAASADREAILKNLDLMDEEAQQAAKTKVARVAAGGNYEKPTPAKLGIATTGIKQARKRAVSLEGRAARGAAGRSLTEHEARVRLDTLEQQHAKALDEIAAAHFGPVDRGEVARRNVENAKAARQQAGKNRAGRAGGYSGVKAIARETVTAERRNEAEKIVDEAIAKNPDHPVSKRWTQRTDAIEQLRTALNPDIGEKINRKALGKTGVPTNPERQARIEAAAMVARGDLTTAEKAAASRVKPTGVVGANDITASPNAVFVGNPVERGRITGRPKVSSTGTFGHTSKPSSLKVSTGAAVEHARERNDVTNIVAERHAEAVRLSQFQRRVALVKKAGEATPRRKDDVFVWTDKTVSNARIPKEVRGYLDNPESIAKLPEAKQHSIVDQIKAAVLEEHDWTDPEKKAEFEKLAAKGQGVFVPRRLLGDAGKRNPNVSAIPGIGFVDAVNNAQKAALVYLKLNYPLVQGISNVAMGFIQQGFAHPLYLTRAVKLDKAAGPEVAAVIDDIMGQGAVQQAAFHGQGAISHLSQKLAGMMSHGVDTPARRAAFLYEARKAGFGTPARLKALIENDENVHKLAEVAQRAKEAIVDYGELSPTERQLIRRLVFVYPWQKGATKYAGQFLRDHPAQAAVAAQVGQIGTNVNDQKLGAVPSYLQGVFDVGGGLVNPSGVNFFQTPAQIGLAAAGYATGNPATPSGRDFLAPLPDALVAAITRTDSLGRKLPGNPLKAAQREFVDGVPLFDLIRAAAGNGRTSRTFPNPNDPLWRFELGGLYPRKYSRPALNRNAGLEKSGR